jgi:zinc transport system permease protein
MLEILQYGFMVRAILAGLIVAMAIPVLGSFLVARRYSLIADSLAHVSLAGVGLGLLIGFSPVVVAIPVTIAGALLLEWLRQNQRISGEVSLAILMSGGLAVAVVLANFARGANTDFTSYLFGSIATTAWSDVGLLALVATLALALVLGNFRALLHIAFDEDSARIAGYRVTLLNYLVAGATALIVVLSLRIVGGLLVSALLVMPVITASRFARSFTQNMLLALGFAIVAVIAGLLVAFYAGVAAGGAIVLSALALLIGAMILKS